jgi:two-component system phosphate regulon sensor histidine kinase PhoR
MLTLHSLFDFLYFCAKMTGLKKHQLTAFTGFITLVVVLLYLIYNTFELKDREYQLNLREVLKQFFLEKGNKGNIYPAAFIIVDNHLKKNIQVLEMEYLKAGTVHNQYTNLLLAGMLDELRNHNPLDSMFSEARKEYKLDEKLHYRMVVNSIKLRFRDNRPLPLYDRQTKYPFLDPKLQSANGYVIGGQLDLPRSADMISSISLSPAVPYTYEINLTLFAGRNDRYLEIVKSAIPILLLTLFALTSVVLIYYYTFKNWIRQKKLSELKSDFVNSITHEFNTPIATIMVANRALQNEKILESKVSIAEFTAIIARQAKRLQTLFGQVLDLSEVAANVEKTEVIFCQLLAEVVEDYRLKVVDENVVITADGIANESEVLLNKFG